MAHAHHSHMHSLLLHQEQFGVQRVAQGHFSTLTERVGDQAIDRSRDDHFSAVSEILATLLQIEQKYLKSTSNVHVLQRINDHVFRSNTIM